MKINSFDRNTHYIFLYQIESIKTKKASLSWFDTLMQKEIFTNYSIELEDYRSFHDGTISTSLTNIYNVESFVSAYENEPYKSISVTGEYKERPFSLGISLESGIITLSCRKNKMVDYKELEQILELV